MRTLIIPCAGHHRINGRPVYMAQHPQDGELILQKAIEGVFPQTYDRILVVIPQTDIRRYHLNLLMNDNLRHDWPVELLGLTKTTDGPADTVYETLQQAQVKGEFAVKDAHSFVDLAEPAQGNMIAGLDLTDYPGTIENLRAKSFIVVNEQHQVLDVIEKRFRSDIISVGLYSFRYVEDYLLAYQHLKSPDYPIDKLYLSHVISYLIGYKNRIFQCCQVKSFEDWSTEKAWEDISKRYATYILDFDMLFMAGKSQNSINRKLARLARFGAAGARFICMTAKTDFTDYATVVEENSPLRPYIIAMVNGCTASKYHLMIDKWSDFQMMLTGE